MGLILVVKSNLYHNEMESANSPPVVEAAAVAHARESKVKRHVRRSDLTGRCGVMMPPLGEVLWGWARRANFTLPSKSAPLMWRREAGVAMLLWACAFILFHPSLRQLSMEIPQSLRISAVVVAVVFGLSGCGGYPGQPSHLTQAMANAVVYLPPPISSAPPKQGGAEVPVVKSPPQNEPVSAPKPTPAIGEVTSPQAPVGVQAAAIAPEKETDSKVAVRASGRSMGQIPIFMVKDRSTDVTTGPYDPNSWRRFQTTIGPDGLPRIIFDPQTVRPALMEEKAQNTPGVIMVMGKMDSILLEAPKP